MNIKKNMLKYEQYLYKYASLDKDAIRFNENINDIRPNYYRDIDRIIHSLSYTRYSDKTQVYSITDNDNITKRIIHVQLVSKIARTIGRALLLNEDLIEAIALGHDIGHVPFGHVGESILNTISIKNNEGIFMHNIESVRNLMFLEKKGNGINLSVQVLDGILCHNGEKLLKKYTYSNKSKEDFLNDYYNSYKDKKIVNNLTPMTLEACVVRISDVIAYVGRDLEDAINLKKIKRKDIPESVINVLGTTNRSIVNTIIMDVINNSIEKNYIEISDEVYTALNKLLKFNYEFIYSKANTKEQIKEYEFMFNVIFEKSLYILENNMTDYNIFKKYLDNMDNSYQEKHSKERIAIDYISGMTDNYFINEFNILKKI